jgi:hypothetical protein
MQNEKKCPYSKRKTKVLFICKKRKHPYEYTEIDDNLKSNENTKILKSSGLLNSAKFVSKMLNKNNIESKVVDVIDNNSIDKVVKEFKPDYVIIEALWVVPEKFEVLTKLHPKVKWIVRLHSEIPFLSNEGIAIEWLYKYIKYKNVYIGSNSIEATEILENILKTKLFYLPNYYPIKSEGGCPVVETQENTINIGCFGAIRPMKNQLQQAIASIEFGDSLNKSIRFHINSERIESRGEPVLKNIRELFKNNPKHTLVEHHWHDHHDFINLVRKMDIGLQVSFSETFNIVSADFVSNGIPVIVSPEINWASRIFKVNPNSNKEIVKKLKFVWKYKKFGLNLFSLFGLIKYNWKSKNEWLNYFL